jgi:hypothetical protein
MSDLEQDLQKLSDDEILSRLERAEMMERFLESEDWKLFRESWRRLYEEAGKKLDTVDPKDAITITKYQMRRNFYQNVLLGTIGYVRAEAETAFQVTKGRGLINEFVRRFRSKIREANPLKAIVTPHVKGE